MDIGEFLFGAEEKLNKVPTMSRGQTGILNQLLKLLGGMGSQGGGYNQAMGLLQQYLDPESEVYKNFEAPYMRQFNEQTIPQLAERFAGMGAQGGALSSSGFGQALGAAGAGLQENLASMKSGMQRQAAGDIMGQYNNLLGQGLGAQPFGYHQKSASTGLVPNVLANFAQGLGKSIGMG